MTNFNEIIGYPLNRTQVIRYKDTNYLLAYQIFSDVS